MPARTDAVRPRKSRGRQRQRLIDACISALHLHGPSRTTVEKVVAIAKMSPGIVRFYFDSKAAMLVASLQFLAAEFDERLLQPVAALKSRPAAALELMIELYLDPDIASPRKVSVWYAFWGEASSRQEYYDICGQKDESFAALVHELIEGMIAESGLAHLDADGITLGFIGALEILWQEFAFRAEHSIDRAAAKRRCLAYLGSVFPGRFPRGGNSDASARRPPGQAAAAQLAADAPFPAWTYGDTCLHARERTRLFASSWVVVGHESQIPAAGDYLAVDIGVERALVVRGDSGAIHALCNSCAAAPHLLAANFSGRFDGGIECRLHGLRFSLDGRCTAGADGGDLRVLDYRSVAGLLFARRHAAPRGTGAAAPGAGLGSGPAVMDVEPAAFGGEPAWFASEPPVSLTTLGPPEAIPVAADWKVVVEQWLASLRPTGFAAEPRPGPHGVAWEVSPADDSGWSGRSYRRLLADISPRNWRRHFIAPNQLFEMRPDGLTVLQALPAGAGRCLLRRQEYTGLGRGGAARALSYLARRLGAAVRRDAVGIAESIQEGVMRYGAATTGDGRWPAVTWFRRELKRRLPELNHARPAGIA